MTGSEMFAVVWLSMATTVYAWGAVMIVATRARRIRPWNTFFVGDPEVWPILTITTVILWPAAATLLANDAVQIYREVNR